MSRTPHTARLSDSRMGLRLAAVNAPRLRADRRRDWLLITAHLLAWISAGVLAFMIFSYAIEHARADAARAPILMMH